MSFCLLELKFLNINFQLHLTLLPEYKKGSSRIQEAKVFILFPLVHLPALKIRCMTLELAQYLPSKNQGNALKMAQI